ncbi:unnamed protein product, partial [Nesidiocoris tenuis]
DEKLFLLDAWTIHRESVSSFAEDSEAYIVTKDNFIRIRGFSILSDDIVDKGKVYIACALENCNGTLHFQNGKQVENATKKQHLDASLFFVQVVTFPRSGKYRIHHLHSGQYNVSVTSPQVRNMRVTKNFTVQPTGLYASIIYRSQGKIGFRTFSMTTPSELNVSLFFVLVFYTVYVQKDAMTYISVPSLKIYGLDCRIQVLEHESAIKNFCPYAVSSKTHRRSGPISKKKKKKNERLANFPVTCTSYKGILRINSRPLKNDQIRMNQKSGHRNYKRFSSSGNSAVLRAARCRFCPSRNASIIVGKARLALMLPSATGIVVVLWKHSVVREEQHLGVCSRRTSANEERRGQTIRYLINIYLNK